MIDNNSKQLNKLINEIEGRLNDFEAGITEKDETIKSFADLIMGCVETANKVNFTRLLKDKIKEIQRIKDQTPKNNIMYKGKMMMGTYGILICEDLLNKLKSKISV